MRQKSERKKCGVDRRSVVAVFTRSRKACLFLFGSIIVRLGVVAVREYVCTLLCVQ